MSISPSQRGCVLTRRSILTRGAAAGLLASVRPAGATMPKVQARFVLVSHRGERVTEKALKGSASLVVFGFTGCPDICPTTLMDLTQFYSTLGSAGDRLKTYFITVDPENDTVERLALYLESFDSRIVGLTGPRSDIEAALRAFLANAEKIQTPAGESWSHSTGVYVFDAGVTFIDFLDLSAGPEKALRDLRPYLAKR